MIRLIDAAVLVVYYSLLLLLSVYSLHRFHLVRLRGRLACDRAGTPPPPNSWPSVTVQLPLYNEPNVAGRLIEAAGHLQYPGELEIQVLDDSTDSTFEIARAGIEQLRSRGIDATHVRRSDRAGFKAGALANGLRVSSGEILAIFDADFIPPRRILLDMVPFFFDPGIGMVQARWGHLNREESMLTRIQAIYLDSHFAIESAARYLSGRFFNFNGTAGLWRREAIEDSGGWSSSTLTEDLDLSYRAQLAGWRFIFLSALEVPAELPSTMSSFQDQQHRWAKGSIQTARRVLFRILREKLPARVKVEAFFHLTNNCAYVLTLLLGVFLVPSLLLRERVGFRWTLLFDVLLFTISSGAVLWFYLEGQKRLGRPRPSVRDLVCLLPLGIGLSVSNAAAVLEGFLQNGGDFRRTPKTGRQNASPCRHDRAPRVPVAEILLASFFLVAVFVFATIREFLGIPFLLLFLGGYAHVAIRGTIERLRFRAQV